MHLEYLHRPADPIAENKKELLVLLHGYGSNMQDLFSFAAEIPKNYEVVSMQAPLPLGMASMGLGGFAWYEINFMDAQKFNNTEQAFVSMQKILSDIQEHQQLWACSNKPVNLCGFSQGGILSYALSLQNPSIFNKILCLSAYPAYDVLGEIDKEENFSALEFYISHGVEDMVIPIEWAREGERLMKELKITYTYQEYRSGHGINPQNFHDLIEFLK